MFSSAISTLFTFKYFYRFFGQLFLEGLAAVFMSIAFILFIVFLFSQVFRSHVLKRYRCLNCGYVFMRPVRNVPLVVEEEDTKIYSSEEDDTRVY